jgi:hypothetical protein
LVSNNSRIDKDKSLKHSLKILRWTARRALAALRWGSANLAATPAVLGNAMPKSGSHLIIQVLQGLINVGPFVNPGFPPVDRTEDNRQISEAGIVANIYRMKPGDIGYGYLHAREPFTEAMTRPGMASVFVYRDPRDMIISHVFYATEIHQDHAMHRFYTEELTTMEQRINAAINGVNKGDLHMRGVKSRYEAYQDWLVNPDVLCLRFEDLILNRTATFNQLLDYLENKGLRSSVSRKRAVEFLNAAIEPHKSGTFRKGKPGNWREHFTQDNVDHFKKASGDLLLQLGYESDTDW